MRGNTGKYQNCDKWDVLRYTVMTPGKEFPDRKSNTELEMEVPGIMNIIFIPKIKVQTNGVGLGEMDNMLLMKVEELMLYVIELKKENEGLKEDNNSIKAYLIKEIESIKTQLK